MAELKTKSNMGDVNTFIESVDGEQKRADCKVLVSLMEEITGQHPTMWGSSIIGFGTHHYRYESGREGEWFQAGFAPRKNALTLYIRGGFPKQDYLMK